MIEIDGISEKHPLEILIFKTLLSIRLEYKNYDAYKLQLK